MLLVEQTHTALLRLAEELEARSIHRLPPERDLALRLGTSRTTVRKALDALERDGVIHRIRGRAGGAYLARPGGTPASGKAVSRTGAARPEGLVPTDFCRPADFTPEDLAPDDIPTDGVEMAAGCRSRRLQRSLNTAKGVPQMLHEQGFRDGTEVISACLEGPSPRAAQRLGVDARSKVVSLLRIRFADGDTLSLERMYLRAECVGVLRTHLDSVYESLKERTGISVCAADESIELATISAPVGSMLGQPAGTSELRLERVGYDESARPVEYSVDLFRADRTRLNVRTASPVSASVSEPTEVS